MNRSLLPLLLIIALVGHNPCMSKTRDPVKLAFTRTSGTTEHYRLHQRVTGTRAIAGSAVPAKVDVDAWSKVHARLGRVDRNGSCEMELQVEPSILKLAGKPADSMPPARTVTLTVGKDGRLVADPKQPQLGGDATDFGTVQSVLMLLVLPDHPVSVGESWTAQDAGTDSSAALVRSYTLESISTKSGETLAHLKLGIRVVNPIGDTGSTSEGTEVGAAELVFSVTRGKLVSATGWAKSVQRRSTAGHGQAQAEQPGPVIARLEHRFDLQPMSYVTPNGH